MISFAFALLTLTSTDAFTVGRPATTITRRSFVSMSTPTATEGTKDALAQARSSVDDIAMIKEGRTVDLRKYRNIGIMVIHLFLSPNLLRPQYYFFFALMCFSTISKSQLITTPILFFLPIHALFHY